MFGGNDVTVYPWNDNGEEVVVNEIIASDVIGQPFEVYFYRTGTGYGYMILGDDGIKFNFPKSMRSSYDGFHFDLDLDGDGSLDADDLGCAAALLVTLGLGYLFKKLTEIDAKGKQRITWNTRLQNDEIQKILPDGRTLELIHAGKKPDIMLRVAESDGERLYRELYLHYPTSVAKWTYILNTFAKMKTDNSKSFSTRFF